MVAGTGRTRDTAAGRNRDTVVELDEVAKRYGRRAPEVLTGVSLAVSPGQVVAVVGANGSGKTTLLRLLAGVTSPTRGSMRRHAGVVGYVPERFPRAVPFTVAEYLAHMGRIRGLPAEVQRCAITDLLDRFELRDHSRRRIGVLSKGTRQKVAIVQALLARPDLLVLDEPWSGLDATAQAALTTTIGTVAAGGGAVVFTDHRPALVAAVAHRILRMARGSVHPEGLVAGRPDAVVRIEVDCVDPVGAAERAGHLPGVLAVNPDRLGLLVEATVAHGDAVLSELLRLGLSVRRVERVAAHPGREEEATS